MSTSSKYHEEVMVNIGTKEHPIMRVRRKCVMAPQEITAKDGETKFVCMSDRHYIKRKDGALISTKTKISKQERRKQRESTMNEVNHAL